MSTLKPRRTLSAAAVILSVAMLATGCADDQGGSSASPSLGLSLTTAAFNKAKEIAGDQKLTGSITFISTLGGDERNRYLATLKPFEEATGVKIEYTGSEDYQALVQSSIDAGKPIDVVQAGNTSIVRKYAGSGKMVDLNKLVGKDQLASAFNPSMLASTTKDGANYGLWSMLSNYEIWYNPASYSGPKGTDVTWDQLSAWTDEQSKSGHAPWCMGLSAGASTGWPGAYFVLNILLKQAGTDFVAALGRGQASWDSPEVRAAFATFAKVVASDKTVAGGPSGVITTDPGEAGLGMYADPSQCSLMHWGTFTASILQAAEPKAEPVKGLDFMPMPTINPAYAKAEGYGGNVMSAFSDRPEVAALMKYLASVEESNLIAATGNWTGTNVKTNNSDYPNELLGKILKEILEGTDLVPFPTAVAPAAVNSALYKAVSEFVQKPSSLDANLAAVQTAAKASS